MWFTRIYWLLLISLRFTSGQDELEDIGDNDQTAIYGEWDPDLYPPTADFVDEHYTDTGGYQMSEQSVKGWTIDSHDTAMAIDCAKAFNRIPRQNEFGEGLVLKFGLCSIKAAARGIEVPGALIDDFALELLLILSRGTSEPSYKKNISGTYFANFKVKALCMGDHMRPCP